MKRIGISTDCVCDLPETFLRANGVDLVHFYIDTNTGKFRDGYGITSRNVLEYLQEGGTMAETNAPEPQEYVEFFERELERCDELIHIALSGHIGNSCKNAMAAMERMNEKAKRVTVIDSEHLSTGLGHMVMLAVEMRDGGKSTEEIAAAVKALRGKISTTFITPNADALYRNGRVSGTIRELAALFSLHPVLAMRRGKMALKMLGIGDYERSVLRYVRRELKNSDEIDQKRLFITHAGCPVRLIAKVKEEAERSCRFDEVIVTQSSATVSCNCGAGAVGVLFVRK